MTKSVDLSAVRPSGRGVDWSSIVQFGLFIPPYSTAYADGRRAFKDVVDWDLRVVQWADEYGFAEAFFAEHHTVAIEPSPAPDLMIAMAAQVTSRITLGAAAHLLPYHNPIALAHRMIVLDHVTGGRYIAGAAPGAYPSDAQLFCTGKNNPEMMVEALDIIEAIWTKPAPFTIEGKYWSVDMPAPEDGMHGQHLKPLQSPHPRIAMTGMQAKSPTLTLAGSRGYLPFSQQVSADALNQHWDTYSTAAVGAGFEPKRSDWRVFRDIFVADTDEEARRAVLDGAAAEAWNTYLLPQYSRLNLIPILAGDSVDPNDVTPEWLVDNFWLVGSPATVRDKMRALNDECGGIGTIVSFTYDYSANPDVYQRNFELMATEVIPQLRTL
jgi:alkanesulfonate monooxygenase SsuD/methylene tetrahydromethanopterin reductase-like flavin-dependent oxidoreductase (luciferase family)